MPTPNFYQLEIAKLAVQLVAANRVARASRTQYANYNPGQLTEFDAVKQAKRIVEHAARIIDEDGPPTTGGLINQVKRLKEQLDTTVHALCAIAESVDGEVYLWNRIAKAALDKIGSKTR